MYLNIEKLSFIFLIWLCSCINCLEAQLLIFTFEKNKKGIRNKKINTETEKR